MATIPTIEPTAFFAGDTVKWDKSFSDYPASGGWTLTYYLRGTNTYTVNQITTTGDTFNVNIPAATTATYAAGDYWLFGFVTKGTERFQIYSGQVEVKPNQATLSSTYDGRTHVQIVLDALEAAIEGVATREELSYTVNSGGIQRMIQFLSRAEMIQMHAYYSNLRRQEVAAENIAKGKGSGNRILTRFTEPT